MLPHCGQQVEQCRLFFLGSVKERSYVSLRDNQGMTGRNGETVVDGDGMGVGQADSGIVESAEGA